MPLLLIIAGSNGAGKTTFAKPYVADRGLRFLNADELTREFEQRGEAQALVKAGRQFLQEVDTAITSGEDFAMETTLSGSYIYGVVERAKAAGYRVELVYLFVKSPAEAVARVAQRVLKGGHDVPEEAIRRRYARSRRNFLRLRELTDMWELYYSSPHRVLLVAKRTDKFSVIFIDDVYHAFID